MTEEQAEYRAGVLPPEAERAAARREEHVDCPSPRGYVGSLAQQMSQRIDKRRWANAVRRLAGLPRLTPEDADYAQE